MRDFIRLREHLRIALACAPLFLGGCAKDERPAPRTVAASPTPTSAPAPAPPREPPFVHRMPSCPSGTWCGSAADARSAAVKEAASKLDCPTELAAGDGQTRPKDWPGPDRMYIRMNLDEAATQEKRAAKEASTCCYTWVQPCPGGRPLLDEGRPVVAETQPADDLPALAAAWLADALSEHASVASFARATLELMAVGAPPALLAGCQRAALDEIRHAERCFALAARYAGRAFEPGPLPALAPRGGGLARLAVDTFREGCVGETVAALAATRALVGCRDEQVRRVLSGIVKDETRHAGLAWQTLAWAVRAGGPEVAEAVRAAAVAPPDDDEPAAADPSLAAHGRLDRPTALAARRDAWRNVILPTLEELIG